MTRYGKWLVTALAVSLAINLILVGFLAGRWLQTAGPPAGHDPALLLWPAVKGLPAAEREALRPALRQSLRASRDQVRLIRQAQRAVQESLRSERFSASELARDLEALRRALNDGQVVRHATLVQVAERLGPEERRRLATDMAAHGRPSIGSPPPPEPVFPGLPPSPGAAP
jgi:uncharacterized membrane protein